MVAGASSDESLPQPATSVTTATAPTASVTIRMRPVVDELSSGRVGRGRRSAEFIAGRYPIADVPTPGAPARRGSPSLEAGPQTDQMAMELRIGEWTERRGERAARARSRIDEREHNHLVTGVARAFESVQPIDDGRVDGARQLTAVDLETIADELELRHIAEGPEPGDRLGHRRRIQFVGHRRALLMSPMLRPNASCMTHRAGWWAKLSSMDSSDTAPSQRIVRLVGVYDADSTLRGELAYWVGARLGRRHCSLCDITHGSIRRRPEWTSCQAELSVSFDTFHRNDQPDAVRAAADGRAPVVVAETEIGHVLLLTPDELEACDGSIDRLVEAVELAAAGRGLSLEPA